MKENLEFQHWIEFARKLESFLFLALESIPDRDHDILIDAYGLTRLHPLRKQSKPTFPSESARKRALSHARERLEVALKDTLVSKSALTEILIDLVTTSPAAARANR